VIQRRIVDVSQIKPGKTIALPALSGIYRFRRLTLADFEVSSLGLEKGRVHRFSQRLRKGHQAWGYVDRTGGLACYLWFSSPLFNAPPADFECGLKVKTQKDAAYIWDCRTHPDHRERGLYRHGLVELANRAAQFGARVVQIVTRRENTRSQQSIEAAGYRRIASVVCFRWFNVVMIVSKRMLALKFVGSVISLPLGE